MPIGSKFVYSDVKKGTIISEKEKIQMIVLKDSVLRNLTGVRDMFSKEDLSYKLKYKSIYGDKWELSNINDNNTPVKIE